MKLYAPKYYKNFTCIADRCKHSCCVGWEIDIDARSLEKYKSYTDGYGKCVAESIEYKETPHFRLLEGERCPHLDSSGLCKLITQLGEEALCDICREHPRFYSFTRGAALVGLGMSCEEAARIILTSDEYSQFIELSEMDGDECASDFDTFSHINDIYSVISDRRIPYSERLFRISRDYSVSLDSMSLDTEAELISSLEYLNGQNKDRFIRAISQDGRGTGIEKMLERALAYFIFRYVGAAEDEVELRCAVLLSLFLERLLARVACREGIDGVSNFTELCRTLSEEIEYSEQNIDNIKLELSFLI